MPDGVLVIRALGRDDPDRGHLFRVSWGPGEEGGSRTLLTSTQVHEVIAEWLRSIGEDPRRTG